MSRRKFASPWKPMCLFRNVNGGLVAVPTASAQPCRFLWTEDMSSYWDSELINSPWLYAKHVRSDGPSRKGTLLLVFCCLWQIYLENSNWFRERKLNKHVTWASVRTPDTLTAMLPIVCAETVTMPVITETASPLSIEKVAEFARTNVHRKSDIAQKKWSIVDILQHKKKCKYKQLLAQKVKSRMYMEVKTFENRNVRTWGLNLKAS